MPEVGRQTGQMALDVDAVPVPSQQRPDRLGTRRRRKSCGVGPGVGSFSVREQQIFTQDQRGDQEMVSSYLLATGEPVWRHADPVRFWDSHAGARATPMVAGDRLYTLGGTGLLTALDAQPGRRLVGTRRHHRTRRDLVGMGLRRLAAGVDQVVVRVVRMSSRSSMRAVRMS